MINKYVLQVINLLNVPKHLIEKINDIPAKPGIYQMKDSHGNIIYIGKSKALKSRVKSYFNTQHKWNKIKRMVFHIQDIDFIVTDTHLEAQILECALIKKIKPIYNSQFKNHQKYSYLKVESNNRYKPLAIVNQREDDSCFGPYRNKNILLELISFFERIYPITKYDNDYHFTYKILPEQTSEDLFQINRNCIIEVFTIKECMVKFSSTLEEMMNQAALDFQFETASVYRDIHYYVKYLYDNNIQRLNTLSTRRILMGEKLTDGYKLFFITNETIVLKRKYDNITKNEIQEFLKRALVQEGKIPQIKNEKSYLDFKHIINLEIQDETSKSILRIEGNDNIDAFIERLINVSEI